MKNDGCFPPWSWEESPEVLAPHSSSCSNSLYAPPPLPLLIWEWDPEVLADDPV